MTYEELQAVNAAVKTVNIKGKEYVPVQERIMAFRKVYPEGFIITDLLSNENGICIIRAEVGKRAASGDIQILGTGIAYEKETSSYINKTSYIENCETSAVGRALGMAGFGIDASVASFEEVANAITQQEAQKAPKRAKGQSSTTETVEAREKAPEGLGGHISAKDWTVLKTMCKEKGIDPEEVLTRYGYGKPSEVTLAMYQDMVTAIAEGKL